MKKIYIIIAVFLLFLISCDSDEVEMETVGQLDINKFMGDWYVIGIIPNFIEENASNGIESYRLNAKGHVDIQYTFQKKGKTKTMNARAFIQDSTNSFWKVQFLWPVKLPYLVIDLAEDYSYTVIGVPNKKFVWIMGRNHQMPAETYDKILENLKAVGYDISQIKKMEQEW